MTLPIGNKNTYEGVNNTKHSIRKSFDKFESWDNKSGLKKPSLFTFTILKGSQELY